MSLGTYSRMIVPLYERYGSDRHYARLCIPLWSEIEILLFTLAYQLGRAA